LSDTDNTLPALHVDDTLPSDDLVVSGIYKQPCALKLGYIILPIFIGKLPSGHFFFTHIVIVLTVGLSFVLDCCINLRTTELTSGGIISLLSNSFNLGSSIEYVTVLYSELQVVDVGIVFEVIGNAGVGARVAEILYILYIYKLN
jgi:hypothetical protein